MSFIYIAGPYTTKAQGDWTLEERYSEMMRYAAYLMKKGHVPFSPILHNHVLAKEYDLPKTWAFWRTQDLPFVFLSKELHVMQLPHWRESGGVEDEVAHFLGSHSSSALFYVRWNFALKVWDTSQGVPLEDS